MSITDLIHHEYTPPVGFAAPQVPIHKASTVVFANVASMRARDWRSKSGYTYGLHGTPTTFTLEARVATLEHAQHCVLVPSGLAAVTLPAMAFLRTGDEVLLPTNVYGPNLTLACNELARFGVTHRLYDPMNPGDLALKISSATRLVWLEAPGSVSMEFPDLTALLAIVREASLNREREIIVALDNTWGAGLAFNGFDLGQGDGADLVVQALTKYPSGGGDVLMGSVCTRRDDLHEALTAAHMHMGYGVGANDCELVLRNLSSIELRYDAQDRAGRALAAWCAARPEIAAVHHPALAGAPGHANWLSLCGQAARSDGPSIPGRAAGLFSVVFQPHFAQPQVDAFVDALKLFKVGFSWAGPMSLAVPYDMGSLRSNWRGGCLVRFSLGLERVEDLIADLDQGLRFP